MKNILMTVISLLLTGLIIIVIVKGISVGNFKILSIKDIKEESMQMDADIEKLNELKNTDYKKKVSDLQDATKSLTKSKNDYLDIASMSSDEEIKQANQIQTYSMEFLWNKVGKYATDQGLTLKWEAKPTGASNKYNLSFSVTGGYIPIINYISNLENDSELLFTIENFKMTSSSDTVVSAEFTVSNIGIKQESISSSSSTSSSSSSTTTNNTTNNTTNGTTTSGSSTTNGDSVKSFVERNSNLDVNRIDEAAK